MYYIMTYLAFIQDEHKPTKPPMTNFLKVLEFMSTFGQSVNSNPKTDITRTDKTTIGLRLALIKEEVKELEEAIKNDDFTEIIDALCDILYVTYGAGGSIGVDLDHEFDVVHDSNMSKACVSESEADQTIQYYKNNPQLGYDSPSKRKKGDKWIIFNSNTGKVLKNINYTAANLTNPRSIKDKLEIKYPIQTVE